MKNISLPFVGTVKELRAELDNSNRDDVRVVDLIEATLEDELPMGDTKPLVSDISECVMPDEVGEL